MYGHFRKLTDSILCEYLRKSSPFNSTHHAKLYPQHGNSIVIRDHRFCDVHPMYTLCGGVRQMVRLTFSQLDVELSDSCVYDHVSVYDGQDDRAPSIGVYCGRVTPQELIQSSDTTLYVVFVSDEADSGRGFVVNWLAVDDANGL